MGEAASRTDKQKAKQASPTPKPTATPTPKPTVLQCRKAKATAHYTASNPIFEDYMNYKPNYLPTEFEHDGKSYKRYLPDKVLDFFNDEFDYQELANWQDLRNLAMAYFTLYSVTLRGYIRRVVVAAHSPTSNGDVTRRKTKLNLPAVVRERLRIGSAYRRNQE